MARVRGAPPPAWRSAPREAAGAAQAGLIEEMVDDVMEGFEDEDAEDEADEEVGKVLQELAVAQTADMQAAPSKQMVQEPAAAAAAEDDDDSEMLARLQQLRS